jgi:flavin reductase (DIM6/NTAB) family NADH-FMN oxidoreductase RutF
MDLPADATFRSMPLDKHAWHPSVLPGQVVLVSSVDADGEPNVAPKSWVSMVAFSGPILGFGCNVDHVTYHNVEATGIFVVNIPDRTLATTIWGLADVHGTERIEASGLRLAPASVVTAPLVVDCRAHLECRLHHIDVYDGGEVFIFGTVVAADIDQSCLGGDVAGQYRRLDPFFFLESGLFAGLGEAARVGEEDE